MTAKLARLEELIGHKFSDLSVLERALTHRSWAYETLAGENDETIRQKHNETIEFIGDSVVGLVVAEHLFTAHPKGTEGELTLMKHRLVSTATLGQVAERLELGKFVMFGKGEEKTGGRKKQALLANTLEAVIGAVFLDGGYIKARHFVTGIFADELRSVTPENSTDYKSLLQEKLQSQKQQAPSYDVVRTEGPPHDRTFWVEAAWDGGRAEGTGNSIKAAEMMAAAEALEKISGASRTKHDPQS